MPVDRVYTASGWVDVVAIPDNTVTIDTNQTITGIKTYGPGDLLMANAAGTIFAEPYSDTNPPVTFNTTESASAPATPDSGLGVQYSLTSDSWPRYKNDTGAVGVMIAVEAYVLSATGTLTVGAGKSFIYCEQAYVVESIRAVVKTPSAGSAIIADVQMGTTVANGVTLFTTAVNRPTIAIGANLSSGVLPDIVAIPAGSFISVDVDQIGSTTTGADLTVNIRLRRV